MTPDTDLFGHPVAAPVVREWAPAAFCDDEYSPGTRVSPSAWLITLPNGDRALDAKDGDGDDDQAMPLVDGERVNFMWLEIYPSIDLEIMQDRTWTVSAQPDHRTQSLTVVNDPDFLSDSLDELVERLLEDLPRSGTSVTYKITCYRWSDELPFFFSKKTGNFETGLAETPAAGAA